MSSIKSNGRKAPATSGGSGKISVILCAHGGAAGAAAAEGHAARLRERGAFEGVMACGLRGAPDLAAVFSRVRSSSAVVVPMLMADGYTCRKVLPAAVADAAPEGLVVRIAPPLGTHPGVADIIARRARQVCLDRGWAMAQTGLLVVGHGTARDPRSGESVEAAATRLRDCRAFADVRAAYLEQSPLAGDALCEIRAEFCLVAGYLFDVGGHAAQDLPALIRTQRPDSFYLGPVGIDPEIVEIIIDRVQYACCGN